ncbi:MAG: serine/threonine-protein kinase PknK [Planctomycetaceae bacterium]
MIPEDPADTLPPREPAVDLFATDLSAVEAAPAILGKYRLVTQLGRGGMGTVYEAEPIDGGSRVALKTLQSGSAASLARLKAEFRVVADLAHPNLVQLGELDTTDREPFFTMEIVRGKAFDEYVRSSFESAAATPSLPYSEQRLRDSLRQLADGLVALHDAGLIHRDIKPSNVMVSSEGRVVILDMGLAVETDEDRFRNSQREFAGTPYFMAPEQARGESMTAAGDWYAVGVMLFEALTGERAFQSHQLDALLKEKLAEERPSPRDVLSAVPEDLNRLCCDLLRPRPEDRPTGAEVLKRLHGTAVPLQETSIWIGRDRELQILRAAWRQVREGEPQVVLVSGPSGMGKTALVDHFLARLRREESVVVLRGRCYENEAVAYRGFDSVVDSLATYLRRLPTGEVERVLPLDTDMLCQLFPVMGEVAAVANRRSRLQGRHGDPRERRQKGIAALRELFCRLASFVSVVIFVDDLQQGDDDTAGIFRELLRRDQSPAALFLGTYRSEDADSNECLRQIRSSQLPPTEQVQLTDQIELSVDKLSLEESVRLASSLLLRHSLTQVEEVQRIANEADGDPLFIRMLAEHRIRYHQSVSDTNAAGDVPWTLATVIEDRVKSLAIHERVAMEVLAAAGRPVDARDLESVVGIDSHSLGLIRSLRVKRLIRRLGDRERIEPFHDKIKETVLGLLSPQRLARYCLSLAEQIDRGSDKRDVEFLANLYRRGGERLKAGQCYEAAAAIADSTFAFYRAIECYRYAIDLLQPAGTHEQTLRRGLGDALANAARSAEAAEQYLKAASVGDADERAKLQQLAALRYLTSGHVEEGIESLRQVLAYYRLPWPSNRLVAVAGLLARSGYLRVRGLRPHIRAGATNQQDRDKLDACWAAAAGLSLVDPLRGSYYIAETLCRSLRMGASETIPRDLAAYMGQVAIGGSRSRASTCRVLRACREISAQQRDPYSNAMQFMTRGIAALLRGQWSASLSCCDAATRWLSDPSCHGKTWELNTARTFALWSLQYQGNLVELSRRQPELLRAAKESDDLFATLNFGTQVMAHLQLAGDQPAESLRRLEEDKARLSGRGFFIQHHNYVLAKTYTLLYEGKSGEALAAIDGQWRHYRHEFLSHIQQVRIDHQQVLARALIAAASQGHDREACLRRAQRLIQSLRRERAAWATALAEAFQAGCDCLSGKQEESRQTLHRASQLLDRAGMRLFAAAAQQHLAGRDGENAAATADRWRALGVACGERMTHTMIPGFDHDQLSPKQVSAS